jgi:hypothetical protein
MRRTNPVTRPALPSPTATAFAAVLLATLGLLLVVQTGCTDDGWDDRDEWDIQEPIQSSGHALTSSGKGSPTVPSTIAGANTEVWAVTQSWWDSNSTSARKAGLAWPANSGLSWEEKYTLWVEGLVRTATHSGGSETFLITNPQGKTLPIPYLECSELALALRSIFASWYGLPFWVEARDGNGQRIFLGHFGFRTETGRYRNTPEFKKKYNDYSHLSAADALASWPKDTALRTRRFYQATDDINEFMGPTAGPGMYFDELLLNKRVGWFQLILLDYFGSMNLADDANAYHVKPENVRGGDILVKRWQRQGIGHVMLVKHVAPRPLGKILAELASGSMPRRQAVWESAAASKMAFTSDYAGGPGTTGNGETYASLGGGLRRFLVPEVSGGKWRMTVLPADLAHYIPFSDEAQRAARPARFQELLETPDPNTLREELLSIIEEKRAHLRTHPSSCSARMAREQAFEQLYSLMQDSFNMSRDQTDAQYRDLEDYVFAELTYDKSRTCCWNSSTPQMYEVIMDLNETRQEQAQSCLMPEVFKAVHGDYEVFRAHAQATNRAGDWKAWSADETCPQATPNNDDVESTHGWTPFCEIRDQLDSGSGGSGTPGADPFEPNDSAAASKELRAGVYNGTAITSGDQDWFHFLPPTGATVRVKIEFAHSVGDIDMAMYKGNEQVDTSTGSGNDETVDTSYDGASELRVKVYGYNGAQAPYTISVSFEGGVDLGDPCDDENETMATATDLGAGVYHGLRICSGGDVDWFRIPATVSAGALSIEFNNAQGNLDLELRNSSGNVLGTSAGNGNTETIQSSNGVRYLKVYGRSGAVADYTLRIVR